MTKYNISKPKKYTDKNTGEEKTFWQNIGTMTEFPRQDGSISRIIEIPAIGLEANVFPITPKDNQPKNNYQTGYAPRPAPQTANQEPIINYAEGEIDPNEIPFN